MELVENEATCNTSLVSERNFSVFVKHCLHCIHTTFRTPEEESNRFRNVLCGVWLFETVAVFLLTNDVLPTRIIQQERIR